MGWELKQEAERGASTPGLKRVTHMTLPIVPVMSCLLAQALANPDVLWRARAYSALL